MFNMKKHYILLFLPILIIVFIFIPNFKKITDSVLYPTQPRNAEMFTRIKLNTADPISELTDLVESSNVDAVLRINRIDRESLKPEMTLIIPSNIDELKDWQYMPNKISTAKNIPKLVIVSQPVQAFGVYENGVLVRSGPVSSGKKLKQTPSGLFFVNWKGEEVVSTFDDEWILKWNMNIDNLAGISMHQYSLPGYPASHSCVRMTEADAYWLYHWTEEWTWQKGAVVSEGTPVIIYGNYDFDNSAPWTLLPENPKASDASRSTLENLVKNYLPKIEAS